MTLTLRYAAISDKGLIRSGNQDSVYAGPRLIAVADGMGGMAAGDLASKIVIEVVSRLDAAPITGDLTGALASGVEEANARIRETVEEDPSKEGMGTTLTAFLFSGESLGMVHIGDSRAYRLRQGRLVQVTKDDTYVQMLVDEGQLSPDEAENHPQRSLLLRALGSNEVEPTFVTLELVPGDRYLLCSDGLSGVVSDDTIAETMRDVPDINEATQRLLQLALRGGAPDNVTVLLADITDNGIVQTTPIVGGAAASDGEESSADQSSAAARAAATASTVETREAAASVDPNAAAEHYDDDQPPPRAGLRARWYVIGALLLAGILFAGGYLVYQNQYYVGVDDDGKVAMFQGFDGEIFGYPLYSKEATSETPVEDLKPAAREEVKSGVQADGRDEARKELKRYTTDSENLLQLCPEPAPTPGSSGSPSEKGSDGESSSPSEKGSESGSSSPSDKGSGSSEKDSPSSSSESADQSAEPTQEPGVDCRPRRG